MILNKTNGKAVEKACGTPYVEEWAGKKVQVYIAKVKAFGEVVPALRIRPQAPKKESLNAERFDKMLEMVKAGKYKKDDALSRFDLTADQAKKVQAA